MTASPIPSVPSARSVPLVPHDTHGGPDHQGVPLHDFSTNSNACGPCPAALAAVRAADATRYPDPRYAALRQTLADFHGVDPDRIVVAASASEFIFRITAAFAQRGDGGVVALPEHGYGDYAAAAGAWQLPVRRALRDGTDATRQLIWRCDPSSPTGQADGALGSLIDGLADRAVCVVDLAYEPLRLRGALAVDRCQRDRVWQLWTPNKALGLTGVRAAYAIAPVGSQQLLAAVRRLAPSWPAGSHGVAMLDSWTQPAVQQWISESLATLRKWNAAQVAVCTAMNWQCMPSIANFFCARPPVESIDALCRNLRLSGIKLRDAASFGLPHHVRLATLAPEAQLALHRTWRLLE